MNIAEYIERKMDYITFKETVFYHKFAQKVGLTDIRTAKELIESDLQELFFTENHVQIEFTHWIYQLQTANPRWLSDILQQTRINNYIVKGN